MIALPNALCRNAQRFIHGPRPESVRRIKTIKERRTEREKSLQPPAALVKSLARRRHRLVSADNIQEQILEGHEDEKHLVAGISNDDKDGREEGVHEVVVRRGNDSNEDEGRVADAEEQVEELPRGILAHLAALKRAPEEPRVVDERHADAEAVAKVHAGHGGELVHVLAAHPHRLGVVVAYRVEEAVFGREQPRRHAWVDDEGQEGEEVCEGQRTPGGGEGGEGGCDVVVPGDEAVGSGVSLGTFIVVV
jgi:hypothetical protein